MNDTKNQDQDVFFRPQRQDEQDAAYRDAWMKQINDITRAQNEIGQPAEGERLHWSQEYSAAKDITPGMMMSDGLPNQTWRRIHRVHIKGTNSETGGNQEYDVIVILKEFTGSLCFDFNDLESVLIPMPVKKLGWELNR